MKKAVLYCLLLIGNVASYAQPGDDDRTDNVMLQNVSIPSPSVAGIAKFTDAPVNYSTGSPDISIPLYTINTGKLSWPITLAYNPSGVKVTDNSGNVGLSWNINAEGAIIQNVMGMKDNGTYQSEGGLSWTNAALLPNTAANWNLLNDLSNGGFDGVPDLYLYNFGSQSGRFIVADEVRLLPRKNLVVSSFLDGNGQKCWKIVDDAGMKYYFMAMETIQTRTSNSNPNYNSWLLTKVADANNVDSIEFEYENTFIELPAFKNYEINTWKDTSSIGNWSVGMEPNDPAIPGTVTNYIQQTTGKQLKRIKFNNGSVEYDIAWNDREDVGSGGSNFNVPRIKNILVKDKDGNTIKAIHFEHDYFVTPGVAGVNGRRLRLASVTFASSPTQIYNPDAQKYTFVYNSTNLPSKQSNAMDHWGYFNGKASNQTLIPTIHTLGLHYYGADRNTSPWHFDAGMLEQVNYPTGGYAKYYWSPHSYTSPGGGYYMSTTDSIISKQIAIEGSGGVLVTEESDYVTLPNNDTFNTVHATITAAAGFPANATAESKTHAQSTVKLYEITGSTAVLKRTLTITASTPYTRTADITLRKGKSYYFTVSSKGWYGYSITGTLHIEWPYVAFDGPSQQLVGGCRVSQIDLYDPMSRDTLTKKYQYSNAALYRRPTYYRKIYKYIDPNEGTSEVVGVHSCEHYEVTGLFLSSNSFDLTGAGSNITYDEVRENIGANGEGGMTIYNFLNFGGTIGEVNASWRRGLLYRTRTYAHSGALVQEINYTMKNNMGTRFAGHTASAAGMHPCANDSIPDTYPAHFFQQVYDFPVDWIYTDTVTTTDYTTGIQTIQASAYNNPQHMLPTSSTTIESDGTKVTKFIKYPTDFTLAGTMNSNETEALKLLQDKHVNNIPIEQYVQKWPVGSSNPLTTGASYTAFKTAGQAADVALMDRSYSVDQTQELTDFQPINVTGNVVNKDNHYSEKANAKQYDKRTNLVSLSTLGDKNSSYIWGYNQSFPIASLNNNDQNKAMAFTSFEKFANGNWIYSESATATADVLTGKRSLDLNSGTASISFTTSDGMVYASGMPSLTGAYIVSYWRKSGSVTVNGINPSTVGMTANGWTYCEHILYSPTAVTVNGNTKIDELRFYPVDARMKSYTYDPLVGMTSQDDATGFIVLYEYDAMGRLTIERDIFGKIIKQHTYQYQVTE